MDTNTLAVLRATHELYCQLTGQWVRTTGNEA
jgi:hypothetical protein